MIRLLIIFLFSLLPLLIAHAAGNAPLGFKFSPYGFYEQGYFDIDNYANNGSLGLAGVGAVIGIKLPVLSIGLEARGGKITSWDITRGNDSIDMAHTTEHPCPKEYYAMGANAALTFWRLSFSYSYLPFSRLVRESGDYKYAYEGVGHIVGLGWQINKLAGFNLLYHYAEYERYSDDVGLDQLSFDKNPDGTTSRTPVSTDTIILSFTLDIDWANFKNYKF